MYRGLGYGFTERVYALALERELVTRGHRVAREVPVPIYYAGELLTTQKMDMVVDGKLIVENTSARSLPETTLPQLLCYLRASRLPVGLLFHFGPEPRFHRCVGRSNDRDEVSSGAGAES